MSNAARIVDPLERLARATERIADVLERDEMRKKRLPPKVTPKVERYVNASDTEKALAIRHATRLGVVRGGRR
jgi:hypothetical protein